METPHSCMHCVWLKIGVFNSCAPNTMCPPWISLIRSNIHIEWRRPTPALMARVSTISTWRACVLFRMSAVYIRQCVFISTVSMRPHLFSFTFRNQMFTWWLLCFMVSWYVPSFFPVEFPCFNRRNSGVVAMVTTLLLLEHSVVAEICVFGYPELRQ